MVYLYDDLKTGEEVEIRLVTLEETNEVTGELICRLDTQAVDYNLQWTPSTRHPQPGCSTALPVLESNADNLSLTFWVDSNCINQRNNEEKKVQVVLMGDIYRQALQVLVWLGPASDSSDLAFEVCHRLWRQGSGVHNVSRKKSGLSTIGKTTTWGTDLEPFTHMLFDENGKFDNRGIHKFVREMDAVQNMLMRPWWAKALYQVRQAVMYSRNDPSRLLFHLASQCRWSKATNPRDKIYGLLGLISGGNESSLVKVDYSQSVEDCFCTAVLDIIKSSGSLEVLQLCRRPPRLKSPSRDGSPKLPLWVSDLRLDTSDFQSATNSSMLDTIGLQSCPGIKEVVAEHPRVKTQLFRASKGSREHGPRSDGNGVLTVSGLMFDTISGVGEMLTGLEAQEDTRLIAQFDYIGSASGFVKLPNASETLAHAFSATLYRGLLGEDSEKTLADHDVEWKRIMGKVESLDQIIPAKWFSQRSKFRRVMACLIWSCPTFPELRE
ncbi:heterokaryon incompatibility protein-domain-containing protein [Pestalotiopsis sp. NC0098]|nr:heterokaryon incompatibility protein-domain-containing protein [Pestalotiopsis sp. NC0098]